MADTKITALTDGGALAAGDVIPIVRAGANKKATWNGGSSSAITKSYAQTAHGLAVKDWVRYSGSAWVKAEADSAANADVVGMVSAVADADNFSVTEFGDCTVSGLTAGLYYLSPSSAGGMTQTEPSTAGQVSKPLGYAISATDFWVQPQRGLVIPAAATVPKEFVLIADGTALATGEDFASFTYEVGADIDGYTLTGAVWTVATVSSSGLPSLGLRKNSTEMFSTNVTIDANETSSRTAATPFVVAGAGAGTVAAGDIIHFDCDVAGTGTKGSKVRLTFTSP